MRSFLGKEEGLCGLGGRRQGMTATHKPHAVVGSFLAVVHPGLAFTPCTASAAVHAGKSAPQDVQCGWFPTRC